MTTGSESANLFSRTWFFSTSNYREMERAEAASALKVNTLQNRAGKIPVVCGVRSNYQTSQRMYTDMWQTIPPPCLPLLSDILFCCCLKYLQWVIHFHCGMHENKITFRNQMHSPFIQPFPATRINVCSFRINLILRLIKIQADATAVND